MAIKPTVKTNWAEGVDALSSPTDAHRWEYGWSTPGDSPTGIGEPPNLNQQNYWQNAVHDWLDYESTYVEEQASEISDHSLDILETRSILQKSETSIWTRWNIDSSEWRSVCWSPSLKLFCAVRSNGGTLGVTTSPDGKYWTIRTSAANSYWTSVCWSPDLNLFCAVASSGAGNRIMTSSNGSTWTGRYAGTEAWYSVCWSPDLNLFCAVGPSTPYNVITSPNGITWTRRNVNKAGVWNSVCWSPELNLFCAVSSSTNRIMTSPDGLTWTLQTPAEVRSWYHVAWSPELGIFLALSKEFPGRGMYSSDGINWTMSEGTWSNVTSGVCWVPELGVFASIGERYKVCLSPDGNIAWELPTDVDVFWSSICWSPGLRKLCAVGWNDTGAGKRTMISSQ